jgi:aryl sulfotransferase
MKPMRPALREYRTWTTDSRRWAGFQPRQGDIIIATYPKSGTTWMQQIVSSLVFQDAEPRPLSEIAPWIGGRFFGDPQSVHARINSQKHRRFVKSHEPMDGIPLYEEIRYIHVARDGRDAAMSLHNQWTGFGRSHDRASISNHTLRSGRDVPILVVYFWSCRPDGRRPRSVILRF